MELQKFGRTFTAQGERWQSLKHIADGVHIAIRVGATSPAECFVVVEDEPEPLST